MKRITLLLVTMLAVMVLAAPVMAGRQDPDAKGNQARLSNQLYVVQMSDAPVVAYDGAIPGLAATRPKGNEKINPNSAKVIKYVDHLNQKHNKTVQAVGGKKVYSYTYTYNGFAAHLTAAQADKIAAQPGVLAVTKDEFYTLDTSSTPAFLGLTNPGSLWYQLGYPAYANKRNPGAGEDVIIGIVDSGIWPEHPSVSDRDANGKLAYQQIPGWHGRCVPGENFNASNCNQKLIGARFYNEGFGGNAGIDATLPFEFNSPRDHNGHGTHTSTTAGGNYGVMPTGPAAAFGPVSGIAPRARIATYKACWSVPGTAGSCSGVDLLAAIDQAVADGVDVINYSISGTRTNFRDPVEIAFLFAADAGVFVSASAGNSGPASSTVAHPGPWLTTVAAGTHNRSGEGSVTLGNGATYYGASVATAVPSSPLVDSVNVGLAGANAIEVELCYPGTLDPAAVTGKIVLCKRGVIARVDKSLAVLQAGGVGMIMYNDPDSSLNADFHFVPTVHVTKADGLAIKSYIAAQGASATASIAQATIVYNLPAPFTASFSSRGPLLAGGGDLLKPDVIAPGQDILAGVAPPGNSDRLFDLYSGTSMSSPHVAGLGALLKDLHPDWSPAMIKSALMTTGYDVLDGGVPAPNTNPVLIFRQGAGHVQPNSAADPGLVFDAGLNDWLAFICNTQPAGLEATCNALWGAGYPTDASDLNIASIAIGDLAGVQTVTRTVTNVGATAETYNVAVSGPSGITVVVAPSSFTLNPGASQEIAITFTRTTAALNSYVGGQITWTGDQGHVVRIPVVIRPVALAAPASVFGTGDLSYDVIFGYDGPFTTAARGLIPAVTTAGVVADDPTDSTCSLSSPNAQLIPVAIPAGTSYARFSLFDDDVAPGADIDLCVANSAGTIVGSSGSGTSAEEVNLLNPASGSYTVVVQGWGVPGSSPFKLHTWLLGTADAGNMTISAPTTAVTGATGTINLTFSGLDPTTRYLGSVVYGGVTGLPNPTIVRIDTP